MIHFTVTHEWVTSYMKFSCHEKKPQAPVHQVVKICTYMHIHIYVYVHIHTYICIFMCMYVCICTYAYINTYVFIYIYVCKYIYTHTHAYMYVYIYIHIHVDTHIYVYICIFFIRRLYCRELNVETYGDPFSLLLFMQRGSSSASLHHATTRCSSHYRSTDLFWLLGWLINDGAILVRYLFQRRLGPLFYRLILIFWFSVLIEMFVTTISFWTFRLWPTESIQWPSGPSPSWNS